jgi:competence protein ComEA
MTPAPIARLRALLDRLGCSPAECAALAVLAVGAVAAVGVLWWLASPGGSTAAPDAGADPTAGPTSAGLTIVDAEVVVHVVGEVEAPGIYRLAGGSRVAEALEAAGGPTAAAVLDAVNLARPLNDGEQLLVPGPQATVGPDGGGHPGHAQPGEPGVSAMRPDGTLSLNHASAADFEELPGIGPVLAERIVDHREQIGGFTSMGQLRDVPGIGEQRFQELSTRLSL